MRLLERSIVRKNHIKKWLAGGTAALAALVLTGCTEAELAAYMPGHKGISDVGDAIGNFWANSWVALMGVGLLTWGLVIWASVAYRRRKNETGMPQQMRYHMPIEIMFTVIPVVLVAGFFAFTAREQAKIEENWADDEREVHIEVYGKQWAWDFNYLEVEGSPHDHAAVYYQGVQAEEVRDADGKTTGEINMDKLPTLYLPVDAKVTIDLKSRDVAHSFWVPQFHYKEDTIPGKTNQMSFTPTEEGTYIGKCAELCGEYHSMMLFQVKVVSAGEYREYLDSLAAQGNTGAVGDEFNRNLHNPGTKVPDIQHEEH